MSVPMTEQALLFADVVESTQLGQRLGAARGGQALLAAEGRR